MTEEALMAAKASSPGVFITFEGGEGVGKSTQILLLARRLEAMGYRPLCLREPGGTPIGEAIRAVLLNPANTALDITAELLLYEAARAQLVSEVIKPALAQGGIVLCDRFTDSTLVYQGIARGLGLEAVRRANQIGSQGLTPDRTIVLVNDPEVALSRAARDGADRLEAEGLSFHRQVYAGFEQLAAAEPQRVRLVAANEGKAETADKVFSQLADLFPQAAARDFTITDDLLEQVKRERG
ncbi:MAG: dTMP kinase [Coriobacteriales bacterium]|jgi:dTMP kinase|nr:dTMP kinase [Coriobacteriales bacterium]